MARFSTREAQGTEDIARIRGLFQDYADWLARDHGIDLAFQGIAEEFATLPGRYAPPGGTLLLGVDGTGAATGCVGLRPLEGATCEIKRLYTRPSARGSGLGRALAERVIDAARDAGYARAVLDTGPFMAAAQGLYRSLGFHEIAPYYHNPVEGCLFMARDLANGAEPG